MDVRNLSLSLGQMIASGIMTTILPVNSAQLHSVGIRNNDENSTCDLFLIESLRFCPKCQE